MRKSCISWSRYIYGTRSKLRGLAVSNECAYNRLSRQVSCLRTDPAPLFRQRREFWSRCGAGAGWLTCIRLTLSALETEDILVLAGVADDGERLDEAQCRRLFDLAATEDGRCEPPAGIAAALDEAVTCRRQELLDETALRNGRWFDIEMDKLDRWAEDRRAALKAELAELDDALREARKAARLAPTLPEKLERQRAARTLESKREEAWRAYDQASRETDRQKDALLDEIGRRLEQKLENKALFALRWILA